MSPLHRMEASRPRAELAGRVPVPASKYHAHRALILASLAEGCSSVDGRTGALHVRMTLAALRRLGTRISKLPAGYRLWGGPYRPTHSRIPVGSSGSTLQFLLGLGCRSVGPALVFDGQKYLRHRPIGPLLAGLRSLGVRLEAAGDGLPVTVHPGRPRGGRVQLPGTLSQWVSGLLLLAPLCSEDVEVEALPPVNERPYLDLTRSMMADFGVEVEAEEEHRRFRVRAGQRYVPASVRLPPDLSSAAFGLAAAACLPGGVVFEGVEPAPDHPEGAVLDVLRAMGAGLDFDAGRRELRVTGGRRLDAVAVDCTDTPDLLPILVVLAAVARGRSVFEHVGHARLKESDRVAAMLQLRRMGARLDDEGDRLVVHGVERLRPAVLSSFNDHRVLMALAVAGCLAGGGTSEISYPQAYRISYPEFLDHAAAMGLPLRVARVEEHARGPWSPTPSVGTAPVMRSAMPEAWHRRFLATGICPHRLITDHLAEAAAWTPDRPAVVDSSRTGRTIGYGELRTLVDRVAQGLVDLGVAPGEPVAFQLPNWWEFVALQLALVRIGAVSCPLMPIFRQRELAFILRQSGCRVLVVPHRFRGVEHPALIEAIRPQLPRLREVVVVGERCPAGARPFGDLLREPRPAHLDGRRPSPDAVTQLLYTSGTSGEPKGVLHTHDSLLSALVAHVRHFGLTDRDTVWVPSPCAHQTGFLYGFWLSVFLGATGVYQDVWDARRGLEAIDGAGARFVQAATPFLTDLVEAVGRRGTPPRSLRTFVATGAPVPRVLAQRARHVLRADVVGAWGTTESGLVTAGAPGDPPERLWRTDGRVLAPMGMRVVDDGGRDLPPGHEGRLWVWTPAAFVGYLGHDDWYRDAFRDDGWFDSGDLARIDADRCLRITGRVKDVINRGGEKVPVAEVEELLYAHPAVAEAAVVAMPDPRLGERSCAFVVLRPGGRLSLTELRRHLEAAGMSRTYWPERLERVDALPHTGSGKIQKYVLRDRVAALLGQEAAVAVSGR